MLIGGDFNCVLQPADTTGPFTTSRALSEIVRGLDILDAWNQDPRRPTFTHHSPTEPPGSTVSMTNDLLLLKTGIEILPAAFTDHNTVVLRLSLPTDVVRGRGRWKMNPRVGDRSLCSGQDKDRVG